MYCMYVCMYVFFFLYLIQFSDNDVTISMVYILLNYLEGYDGCNHPLLFLSSYSPPGSSRLAHLTSVVVRISVT